MDRIETQEEIDHHRRHLIGAGALSLAAAQFSIVGNAVAQSAPPSATNPPSAR